MRAGLLAVSLAVGLLASVGCASKSSGAPSSEQLLGRTDAPCAQFHDTANQAQLRRHGRVSMLRERTAERL